MRKHSGFIFWAVIAVFLGAVRLEAQENATRWSVPESEHGISRKVPFSMTVSDRDSVLWDQPIALPSQKIASEQEAENVPAPVWTRRTPFWGNQVSSGENPAETQSLHPVSMPVGILYPKKAVRRGWEGRTVIAAEILSDGSVGRTAVAQSSGYEILDAAALDSIRTWKFDPAAEGENTISRFVDIPVTFKLEEKT